MAFSSGTLRVGILAILAGLIGAYVIMQVLASKPVVERPRPTTQVIPQVASELPEGRIVAMGDIVLVPMTQAQLNERNVPITTIMVDPGQIIGRRLREPLSPGQFFTTTSMFLEYDGPDLSRRLKQGYRAFSLSMQGYQASTYTAGTTVDVLFRTSPRAAKPDEGQLAIPEMTVTLLQGVQIIHVEHPRPAPPGQNNDRTLRVGAAAAAPPPRPTVVTLAVTSEQAKVLSAAMGHGEISLSPWAADEKVAAPISPRDGLTLEGILGIEPPPAPPTPVPPFVTENYRRGGASVAVFNRDAIHPFQSPPKVKPGTIPEPAQP